MTMLSTDAKDTGSPSRLRTVDETTSFPQPPIACPYVIGPERRIASKKRKQGKREYLSYNGFNKNNSIFCFFSPFFCD